MDTFDFPYFVENTKYDDVDRTVKLGTGHEYHITPVVPDPRIFVLTFEALIWYMSGGQVDYTTDFDLNAGRMDAFYNKHRLHTPFLFEHPKFGLLKVRFGTALALPQPRKNSGGVVENVTVELKEVV